jgi:guanylate kinase
VRRGILFILSSPSGAGKSTLARRLMAWDKNISFSISATTRSPRVGELNGREYFFYSKEKFEEMISNGEMLEHASVFGNLYGSPREPVDVAINEGKDVIFDIDWQGGQQLRNSGLSEDAVSIFILPPSILELQNRLKHRGKDTETVIESRMKKSLDEISHWAEYDYCLVNDDIDNTEKKLQYILEAERLKRSRSPFLIDLVRKLSREFEREV